MRWVNLVSRNPIWYDRTLSPLICKPHSKCQGEALRVLTEHSLGHGQQSQEALEGAIAKSAARGVAFPQDKRRFFSEARATPPPISGLMTNSSTSTLSRST